MDRTGWEIVGLVLSLGVGYLLGLSSTDYIPGSGVGTVTTGQDSEEPWQ
jgi:hypothetical protein